jgi:hypothetical protein
VGASLVSRRQLSKGSDAEREYDPMGWVMTGPSSTLYPSIGTSASAVARDRHATPTSTNRTLLRQKTRVNDIQTQTGDNLYPHAAIAGLLLVGDHRPADHEGPPSSEVKDMTWLRFHRVRTGSFRDGREKMLVDFMDEKNQSRRGEEGRSAGARGHQSLHQGKAVVRGEAREQDRKGLAL